MAFEQWSFEADHHPHPGQYLEGLLSARGIKKGDFAARCGRPAKTISEILAGETVITPETAIQFERVLGIRAQVWLNYEANYRLFLARELEAKSLRGGDAWAKKFPVKELKERGYLSNAASGRLVKDLLGFLGVANMSAWQKVFDQQFATTNFRQSSAHPIDKTAVFCWLRIGEIASANVKCSAFDEKRFRDSFADIRALTGLPRSKFETRLKEICASCGVIVVVEPELPNTRISGAARWISKDRALIQLSTRYKKNDHFWFSFFHEAGHVLLHSKKEIFVDDEEGTSNMEKEADDFAKNVLIPPRRLSTFLSQTPRVDENAIRNFAHEIGIAPGIVVGRLQKDKLGIPWATKLNSLKVPLG